MWMTQLNLILAALKIRLYSIKGCAITLIRDNQIRLALTYHTDLWVKPACRWMTPLNLTLRTLKNRV